WNDTDSDVPPATLAELFEAQAARTPDAPALRYGEASLSSGEEPLSYSQASLTYAELDARASRLAHALIARGAGPERIVALLLPRSVEIVVAQLAVANAGAAFRPLDPAYPAERVAVML